VVGNPILVSNKPSGSADLANIVSEKFENWNATESVRAIIIRNHGVVTVGSSIHSARTVVEALEEWAKMLTISRSEKYNKTMKLTSHSRICHYIG